MTDFSHVAVLDADRARRDRLAERLRQLGKHIESFETVEELAASHPEDRLVMIADEGDTLCGALQFLDEELEGSCNGTPIIAYGTDSRPGHVLEAMREGLDDYVPWPANARSLKDHLEDVRTYYDGQGFSERVAAARRVLAGLGRDQRVILAAIADGLGDREIAGSLGLSRDAVERERAEIKQSLGVQSNADLVRIYLQAKLPKALTGIPDRS